LTHEQIEAPGKIEKQPVRQPPRLLDAFLYPSSVSGIIHLLLFFSGTLFFSFLILLDPFCLFRLLSLGFCIIFVGYIFYYLAECVRDSAAGGTRAPDIWGQPCPPDKWDCICQMIRVFTCVAVCFAPFPIYFLVTKQLDFVFGLLLVAGIIFFPMILLSMVLFDSFYALNPVLIVGSIFSTFFPYCGLVLLFCGLGALVVLIAWSMSQSRIFSYAFSVVLIYLAMVTAHLLGRFYYLNSKKLNWEV